MLEKKEFITNFAGLVVSTGFAIATQGSTHLALGVMGSIAGNLASSFIQKIDYKEIKHLLNQTDPSDLNHDLKKLIIRSVEYAIKNIQILYLKVLENPDEVKELKEFTKNLVEEVKVLNNSLREEERGSLYRNIENPRDQKSILKLFDINVQNFPVINANVPYNEFFKSEFTPNLQLCFGELLKKEKNRPAYIAYQREVYQNLDAGLHKIIEQNNILISKIEDSYEVRNQNKSLREIKKKVRSTAKDSISTEFEASLNNQLLEISQNTAILIAKSQEISTELEKVKNITKGISKDLKTGWVEKNKLKVMAAFGSVVLVVIILLYFVNTLPFDINISTEIDNSRQFHPEYPSLSKEARIRFYLPNETKEKEVTFSNEIILNEMNRSLIDKKIKVELIDPYWELKSDSLLLKKGHQTISIQPNESLSTVKGRILNRNGQELIGNASIFVEGVVGTSDALGNFSIEIPIAKRKKKYLIRVEKSGYEPEEREYFPNYEIEIRLKIL